MSKQDRNYLKLIILIVFLVSFSFFFMVSCSSECDDTDFDGVPDCVDGCIDAEITAEDINPNTGCVEDSVPLSIPSIQNLHVYLEISGSMKGYFQGTKGGGVTGFQTNVSNLVGYLENPNQKTTSINASSFYTIKDDKTIEKVSDTELLKEKIQNNQLQFGKTTTLHHLLAQIEEKNGANDVSVFISDCIYSPHPDKRRIISGIETYIRKVFQNKETSVSVFAFQSTYQGNYYRAFYENKEDEKLNWQDESKTRPYFVWVIGKKEVSTQITKLIENKILKKDMASRQVSFGVSTKTQANNYFIVPYSGRLDGDLSQSFNSRTIHDVPEDEATEYIVGVDLSHLPLYMQNTSYLKNNHTISFEETELLDILSPKDFKLSKDDKSLLRTFKQNPKATHFFKMRTNRLTETVHDVKIGLKYQLPSWIEEWNIDDDKKEKTIDTLSGKTVLLKRIMNAIDEIYEAEHQHTILAHYRLTSMYF